MILVLVSSKWRWTLLECKVEFEPLRKGVSGSQGKPHSVLEYLSTQEPHTMVPGSRYRYVLEVLEYYPAAASGCAARSEQAIDSAIARALWAHSDLYHVLRQRQAAQHARGNAHECMQLATSDMRVLHSGVARGAACAAFAYESSYEVVTL